MTLPQPGLMLANATTDRDPYWPYVKFLMVPIGPDSATVFTDSSPAKRVITVVNQAQVKTDAGFPGGGAALYLDGTGDCVHMPDSADWAVSAGVSWCWDMWLKPEGAYAVIRTALGQAVGTGLYPFTIYRTTAGLLTTAGFDSASAASPSAGGSSAIPDNTWELWSWSFRSGEAATRCFRMGVLAHTQTISANGRFDAAAPMCIGAYSVDDNAATPTRSWQGWVGPTRFTVGHHRYDGSAPFIPARQFPNR